MNISGDSNAPLNSTLLTQSSQPGAIRIYDAEQTTSAVTHRQSEEDADYSVSADAVWLSEAQESLADLSDVDLDKVAELKQAIENGQLPLDVEALSQAIVEMHRG